MHFAPNPHRQRGSVMILVAISGAALIGFLGIVVDLGHLFVTRTELQSATDACALAAAAELRPDLAPADAQAIDRAVNAGITAGNRNMVGFQRASANLTSADILFSDRLSDNSTTFPYGYVPSTAASPATARYAMCTRSQGGITTWFMQVLEGFLGLAPAPKSVGALATATLSPSQMNCALPIGLCKPPAAPGTNPLQGLVVGQWMTSKLEASATGSFDWIDFTPNGGGANELGNIIKGAGQCSLPSAGTEVGEQGNMISLGAAWNTRFGLYKGANTPANAPPDYTGYAYTPTSWPSKFNAFGGTSGTNFQAARNGFMPYQGDTLSGMNIMGNGNSYTNSSTATLQATGGDRRLVTVPVVDCSSWAGSNPQQVQVLAYACVLMLHPMANTNGKTIDPVTGLEVNEEVWLEYRGASNDPASPCNTSGLAGGTAGPLVPVLVH